MVATKVNRFMKLARFGTITIPSHGSPDTLRAQSRRAREPARLGISPVFQGPAAPQYRVDGTRIGMMGECADTVMAHGGELIGVIPEHLQSSEVGHSGITELKVVDSMHVRKKLMFDLSDAFAVLPGGYGTLDELFEIITWRM